MNPFCPYRWHPDFVFMMIASAASDDKDGPMTFSFDGRLTTYFEH